jgi:hypothetical protein
MTGVAKGTTADKEIGEDLQLDRQARQPNAVGKKIDADSSNTLIQGSKGLQCQQRDRGEDVSLKLES